MRKIIFRGKRTDTGEWVYGDLIENQGRYYIYHATSDTTLENEDNSIIVLAEEVDLDTVGQYTGLKDRNGKEIYEGDILVQEIQDNIGLFKDYFEARWEPVGFIGICLNNESKGFTDALESCTDYIVCGNIHDNPELLEEEK